jgi:hypothetical protein
VFHHQRDAIKAHLTVVFAALAVARHLQNATGTSIKKIVQNSDLVPRLAGDSCEPTGHRGAGSRLILGPAEVCAAYGIDLLVSGGVDHHRFPLSSH